jgi:hypothetical protein
MKERTLNRTDLSVACSVIPKIFKLWGLSGREIWEKLNTNWRFRNEFAKVTLSLIDDKKQKKTAFEMAMDILKKDFITPEKVMHNSVLKYSEAQMKMMYASLPQDEGWYKSSVEKDIILHPGTPQPMNLFGVRAIKPANFYSKEKNWWTKDKEKKAFSFSDYVNLQGYEFWHAIKKTAVKDSFDKSWDKQQTLISLDEFVPNASQLAFSMSIVEQIVRMRLFPDCYVRTISTDSDGVRVYLGVFGSVGLFVAGIGATSLSCVLVLLSPGNCSLLEL